LQNTNLSIKEQSDEGSLWDYRFKYSLGQN
jgi:hypothetical protein